MPIVDDIIKGPSGQFYRVINVKYTCMPLEGVKEQVVFDTKAMERFEVVCKLVSDEKKDRHGNN